MCQCSSVYENGRSAGHDRGPRRTSHAAPGGPVLRPWSRQRWRVRHVTEGSVTAESLGDSHSPGTEFLGVTLVV